MTAPVPSRLRAAALLSLSMLLVGSSVPVGKLIVEALPVGLASALRFAMAAACLLPLWQWREPGWPRLSRGDGLRLLLVAFCGSFLFSLFLLYGLRQTSGVSAGIVTGLLPAVVAVLAVLLLRERPQRRTWLGAGLAAAGAILLNLAAADGRGSGDTVIGLALILLAVVNEALYAVIGKSYAGRLSPLFIAASLSTLSALMFLPLGLVEAQDFDLGRITPLLWAALAWHGVAVTVFGFLFWYAGLRGMDAASAGVFTAFLPLAAVLLSLLLLGEGLGAAQAGGILLVLSGALLVTMRRG
jgi:drug/metabolite transporter (DMT)-like permease